MSTPRINPRDPKWTAYVLGELTDAENAAVRQLLESSADARALVEEITAATRAIDESIDTEPSLVLTPAQRAAIRREADARNGSWSTRMGVRWAWVAVATTVAVAVFTSLQISRGPEQAVERAAPTARSIVTDRSNGESTASPPVTPAPETAKPAAQQRASSEPLTPLPAARPAASQLSPASPAASKSAAAVSAAAASAAPAPAASFAAADAVAPVVTVDASSASSGPARTTITGTVRDGAGSVLPGVTVTLATPAGRTVDSTMTNEMGRYSFDGIDSTVAYRVTATLAGFETMSAEVRGGGAGPLQRDFSMRVGSPAETIVVTGETPVAADSLVRQLNGPASPGKTASPAAPAAAASLGRFAGLTRGGNEARGVFGPPSRNESYTSVRENGFVRPAAEPLATFSIDVDTASYSNVRRFLTQNQLPPADAVRTEELVNYFTYDYPRPSGSSPIGASMAVTAAPWNSQHRLVRIGVKAREIDSKKRPASNLVFLIDVSGSMNMPQKLPLVKSALKLLVDQLGENDLVSIVVYASGTGVVLPPTRGDQKETIVSALDNLQAGGSTNGAAGIQLAYNAAAANFIRGGTNRVILMTDGDFNVGITSQSDLTRLIETRAKSGVFLSVLGFGMGNLKDSTMEMLADKGNGHYAYIDTLNEARKVLVEQMSGTLVTVAKDVKIQVDFNPAKVEAYRLIGYENRALRPEDFNDDAKDAGDMGAGHTVTALFEIIPRGGVVPGSVDPSVFQPAPRDPPRPSSNRNELLFLRVRYKLPDAAASTRMDVPLVDRGASFDSADADFRFATAVAAFGMILKDSPYKGSATLDWVRDTASASQGQDRGGYRDEFVSLVQKAIALQHRPYGRD